MAKKSNSLFLFPLVVSVLFILMGGAMIVKGLVAYGVNSRTLKMSGLGGHLFILIGVVFLIVTYYSLSPFSRIVSKRPSPYQYLGWGRLVNFPPVGQQVGESAFIVDVV